MLAAAGLMLVLGETVLRGSLPAAGFLFYYAFCLMLTTAAVLIALSDARASAQRTVQEQRDLLNNTIQKLQHEIRGSSPAEDPRNPKRIDPNQL